jgi:hypothetical protein
LETDAYRVKTQFKEVAQFSPEFKSLQDFAKTFDHHIHPIRNGRVFAFQREGKVFGYADVLYVPVAFPAFHPEHTDARKVVEVLAGWKSHCQIGHGGDGIIGVPLEADRATFPTQMIENAGFVRTKREIYCLSPSE